MLNHKRISRMVHILAMLALVSGTFGLQPVYAAYTETLTENGTPLLPLEAVEALTPLTTASVGNWSALGSNLAGTDGAIGNPYPLDSEVDVIAVSGTDVYVGGCFVNAGGDPTADYLAKWDTLTEEWSGVGNDGSETPDGALKNCIRALAVDGNNIYVGGVPNAWNNGAPVPQAVYGAKWDGTNWSGLGLSAMVTAIAVNGTDVYVGGQFQGVWNGATFVPEAEHIARWDTLTEEWSALGNNGQGEGALVFESLLTDLAITITNSDVYVGGDFTSVYNGLTLVPEAAYVAKWDTLTETWSALGNDGAGGSSINDTVFGLRTDGTNLYAAGWFTNVNNNGTLLPAADYIAKWDTLTGNWSALGHNGAGDGALNGPALPIQISGSDVYVGGAFTNVNNHGMILTAADYVAKWDALTGNWSALGSDGSSNGALNNGVFALGVMGDHLFVGGRFTNVNNNGTELPAADYIATYGLCKSSPVTVQNTNDAGPGSLRQAIADSCSGGTINFDTLLSGETVTLASDLILNKDLTIDGSGLSQQFSINGNNLAHIQVSSSATVTISDLTIENGYNNMDGGGIFVQGSLTLLRSTLQNNHAADDGGAIASQGSINIQDTTLYNNQADGDGGAVYIEGVVPNFITNSTIFQNQAERGGGLRAQGNGDILISNNTLVHNSATLAGAGIYLTGTFLGNVVNSIVVCETGTSSCVEGNYLDTTHTIIDNGVLGDFGLSPLGNHGGPTQTLALLPGSPAIDAGDAGSCPATDQREVVRPQGVGCDIGAYEYPSMTMFISTELEDGWILESSETSGVGGKLNKTATTLRVGDDAANRQYRSILSFDTSTLPEGAVITSVTLKFKDAGKTGTVPFNTHGKLLADICEGTFKNNLALQLGDFQAKCPAGLYKAKALLYTNTKVDNWYSQSLLLEDFQFVNFGGVTQFRLRFAKDDNNDRGADFLKLHSGNALAESDRPQLVIEYYIP